MKRDGILKKMYPTEQAMVRLNAAKRQTAAMINNEIKKGELWAIEEVNETLKKELNEGKVEIMSLQEFKKRAEKEATAFTRLNIAYNLESLSTRVRLIHNFTTAVGSTTLSLEVLTLDPALGSMMEAAFSFRLYELIQCWDIAKCYTQITLVGQFILCSLNLWFRHIQTCEDPFILIRAAMAFGFPAAPEVLELSIFKYIWKKCTNSELKAILDISRFTDSIVNYGRTMEELIERGHQLKEMFADYSLFFKLPTEPWR